MENSFISVSSDNQLSNISPKKKLVAISVIVVAIFLNLIVGVVNMTRKTSVIQVIGEGKISASPGSVSMIVTHASMADDVNKAIDGSEMATNKLIEAAKRLGGNDVSITKSFYELTPQSGKYLIVNAFNLETKNISNINNLIKYLYVNGATTVTNVVFKPSQEEEMEQQVRVEAIKDAKTKAENIAKAAGKNIKRLVSITDDNASVSSTVGESSRGSTSGNLSTIYINKVVSATYEIY